ncbi:MAG: hypothetical protein MJZ20_14500, partial [Bacteroidaceae bacterium]|nr:hypothetical protein [Bacteroidaceae bacterium]
IMDRLETGLTLQRIALMIPDEVNRIIKEDLLLLEKEFVRLYDLESTYKAEVLDAFTRGIEQGRNEVAEDDGK